MNTHKTRSPAISLALAVAAVLAMLATAAPAAELAPEHHTRYQDAHALMTSGQAWDGAVALIELLRAVPADDITLADAFVGPSQLLGFAVASLFGWPERNRLLGEVLKPADYPTDQLLISAMQAGSGIPQMAFPARAALEQLAKGEHLPVKAAALYFLGDPYYYPNSPAQHPAVAELVLSYPDLEFSRCLIEIPVYNALDAAREKGKSDAYLLEDVLYAGGRKEMVLNASPGLAKAAEALPSMRLSGLDDSTIAQWADGLAGNPDPRSRYTVVSLLAKSCWTESRRAKARAGLEALAALPPETPDVLRARMLLADFDRAEHRPEDLENAVRGLLELDVLPCTAERSMYESVMHTAQHAARYFTRLGWHDKAIQTHEALARKFPDTVLAKEEQQQADTIRADGLKASLDLLERETHAPLHNGDIEQVRRIYTDIIAHTSHTALKSAVQTKLGQLESENK